MCCRCFFRYFPKRYFLVTLSFLITLLQISMRTVFTMTLVYLNSTTPENCTTGDTSAANHSRCDCTVSESERIYWNPIVYSQVIMGYFYGYVITQIPGGLLSQRFAAYKIFGISCFVSFLLFMWIPFTIQKSWEVVFVIRLFQGLVEGFSLPAMNGVLTHWARSREKTRLVSIMASGAYLSGAVGLGLTGTMICRTGWSSPFYLFSILGMVLSIFWLAVIRETPSSDPMLGTIEYNQFLETVTARNRSSGSTQAGSVPWKAVFTSLPVSAIFVASFCRCWVFFLLLTEQPQYFRDVFNYNIEQNGTLSTLPHICMTIMVLIGGLLADTILSKGWLSKTVVRKLFNCGGFGVEAAAMLGLAFIHSTMPITAVAVLTIGVGFSGFAISGYQVNPHDLAPDRASILSGVAKLGSVAGIIMPYMVTALTPNHSTHEWQEVFLISAVIHFCGVLYYAIFASGNLQPWSSRYEGSIVNGPRVAEYGAVDDIPEGPLLDSGAHPPMSSLLRRTHDFDSQFWYRSMNLGD